MRLHHVPFSRSFRVLWLLEELGLDYEIIHHSIRDGSLRDPEYLAKSPVGRVPALELDDGVMFESGPICQVLAERYGAGFDRAAEHPERPRYLDLISYAETMANQIEQLNLQLIFLRPPAEPSPVVVKLNLGRLRATLGGLERMLGEQDWLLPTGFSVADTMMGFNIFAAPYYVAMNEFPRLMAYKSRIEARPAYGHARAKDGAHEFYLPEGALDKYR